MRVQLTHDHNDSGAVAVVVALLTVVLVGISAFAVDFGLAYNNKRALQKASDAAALAAASEIGKRTNATQSCAAVVSKYSTDSTFRNAVVSAADNFADSNELASLTRVGDVGVACSADNKRVEVSYAATASTPRIFGSVFGSGDIAATRNAVADVFVRGQGTGLRPYFICDADLQSRLVPTLTTGTFAELQYASTSTGCSPYDGNWFTSDCTGKEPGGLLDENTGFGCSNEIGVLIDQTTSPTQAQIDAAIVDACSAMLGSPAPAVYKCLSGNSGNVRSDVVADEWARLVTLDGIVVPTFKQAWNDYAETILADCKTGGTTTCYPIEGLATVKVCAYKWGSKTGKATDTIACPGIDTFSFPTGGGPDENYLYLRASNVVFSGSANPSGCSLGNSTCDFGGRGVRLIA